MPKTLRQSAGDDGIPRQMMIPSLTTYHQDNAGHRHYWRRDRPVSLIEHPKTTLPESILIPGIRWKEHRSGASDLYRAAKRPPDRTLQGGKTIWRNVHLRPYGTGMIASVACAALALPVFPAFRFRLPPLIR